MRKGIIGSIITVCCLFGHVVSAQNSANQTIYQQEAFKDEKVALKAYLEDDTNLVKTTVLAMVKHKYAEQFFRQFKTDQNVQNLRLSLLYIEQAKKLLPDNALILKSVAAIYYDLRAIPAYRIEALEALEAVSHQLPDELALRMVYLDFLLELTLWDKAVQEAEALYTHNAVFARDTILERMIHAYINAGLPYRGIGFFKKQYDDIADDTGALIAMAILQRRISDEEGASSSINAVLLSTKATSEQRVTARALKDLWANSEPVDIDSGWPE